MLNQGNASNNLIIDYFGTIRIYSMNYQVISIHLELQVDVGPLVPHFSFFTYLFMYWQQMNS